MDEIYRGRYPAESGLLPLGTPTKEDADRAAYIARRILRVLRRSLTEDERVPPGAGETASDAEANGAIEPSETEPHSDANPVE